MDWERAEWVYDSVMGNLVEEIRCEQVENLFTPGKKCDLLYEKMIEAYWHLCEEVGVEEHPDGEIMMNCWMEINRIVGCRMFMYGLQNVAEDRKSTK